jgi:hypothetical protein
MISKLGIFLFVGVVMFSTNSCKSTKSSDSNERVVIIELLKEYTERYIESEYAGYDPIKVKPSNKSLNQYRSKFVLDDIRYQGLINKLNNDNNVVRIIQDSDNDVPVLNSTSIQKAKVQPAVKPVIK